MSTIILALTATCTALMAGLFYAYSCSVTTGLAIVPDAEYILVMQSINKAIQNPAFFLCFFGTLLLLPISTYLSFTHPVPVKFWLLLTAAFLYLTGVFAVTAFGNIPLNNTLEKFNLINASKQDILIQRTMFETLWNKLNTIRTISSILSLILLIISCLYTYNSNLQIPGAIEKK